MGFPTRAGILLDRPASQRPSTAGPWSPTSPTSQNPNSWSPHGSSSSQTVQTLENFMAAGELTRESQLRHVRSIPERSPVLATAMSPPISNPLTQSLEYPTGFPGAFQTRTQPPSAQSVEPQGALRTQQYQQQSEQPARPRTTQEFRFYPAHRSMESSGRIGPSPLSSSHQQLNPPLHGIPDYADTNAHGSPSINHQTPGLIPSATSSSQTRRESATLPTHLQSPESLPPLSIPSQPLQGLPTTFAQNTMAPPSILERAPTFNRRVAGKRKFAEPPRPPSRRSDRIAMKHVTQESEHLPNFTQHSNIIQPLPLREDSELPPMRQLPFLAPKAQGNASEHVEEVPASQELPSVATEELKPVPQAKGAPKKTRKAPAKSVKGTASQPRKRAPKKPKATVPRKNENTEQPVVEPATNPALPVLNEATEADTSQQSSRHVANTVPAIPAGNHRTNDQGSAGNAEDNGCLACQARESEELVAPAMTREDIENLIERRTKEALGPYFAGVGKDMKEVSRNLKEVSASMKEISTNIKDISMDFRVPERLAASS
ncbi:MAG: hypothetical protein M1816_004538 [Peltula sp. TS41687]|nr:MAG: hypothetical protein M1816_004538 [Peltula sp. TS41687]